MYIYLPIHINYISKRKENLKTSGGSGPKVGQKAHQSSTTQVPTLTLPYLHPMPPPPDHLCFLLHPLLPLLRSRRRRLPAPASSSAAKTAAPTLPCFLLRCRRPRRRGSMPKPLPWPILASSSAAATSRPPRCRCNLLRASAAVARRPSPPSLRCRRGGIA